LKFDYTHLISALITINGAYPVFTHKFIILVIVLMPLIQNNCCFYVTL